MTLSYRLGAQIGHGGMGEVFRAWLDDGRAVAVKRIRTKHLSDPRQAERLIEEAATTAKLKHPNIVRLHGAERDQDGQVSMVMELVEGVDLARLLGARRIPLNAAVYVVGEILRALHYAHEQGGIVHRDVSPHNVLLSWDGEVKLSDFGLARAIGRGPTTGGMVRGKLHYLSPEQMQRAPLDGRADLFAVGVIFYEMLAGRLPQSGTQGEIMAQLLNNEPLMPPHALHPELPAELGEVTMRMLERDRAKRYQSAREALAALPDARLGRVELVTLLRELRDTGALTRRPGKRARTWPWTGRVRAALLAAGLLIAGGTVTGVGLWAFLWSPRAAVSTDTPGDQTAERSEQAAAVDESAPAASTGKQAVSTQAAEHSADERAVSTQAAGRSAGERAVSTQAAEHSEQTPAVDAPPTGPARSLHVRRSVAPGTERRQPERVPERGPVPTVVTKKTQPRRTPRNRQASQVERATEHTPERRWRDAPVGGEPPPGMEIPPDLLEGSQP